MRRVPPPAQHQRLTSQRCNQTPEAHVSPTLSLQLAKIADGTEQVFPVLSGFHALKDTVATVRSPGAAVAAGRGRPDALLTLSLSPRRS